MGRRQFLDLPEAWFHGPIWNKWIKGLFIPIVLALYGLYACLSASYWPGGSGGGNAAIALGVASFGAAIALNSMFFLVTFKETYKFAEVGKTVGFAGTVLGFLYALIYEFIHT